MSEISKVKHFKRGRTHLGFYNPFLDTVIIFFFIFSLIFGPKVGPLDFSILMPFMLLLCYLKASVKVDRNELLFFLLFFIVIFYQSSVTLYYGVVDLQPVIRLIRAFIQALLLYLFIKSSPLVNNRNGLDFFYYCALLHSVIIIIGALSPDMNAILSLISGNDKAPDFRSSGLLAGFDISGMIGFISLAYFLYFKAKDDIRFFDIFSILIVFLGCIFTSRVSIFFGGFILCLIIIRFVNNNKISFFLRFFLFNFVIAYAAFFVITIAIIIEFSLSLNLFVLPSEIEYKLKFIFASDSYDTLLDMFFFPDSISATFFGLGAEVSGTDVGYVINTYRFGLVGISLSLLCYFYSVFSVDDVITRRFLLFFLFVILLLNLKNDYLFVRGIFPTFILFYFYSISSNKEVQ